MLDTGAEDRVDMAYTELARYAGTRIGAARCAKATKAWSRSSDAERAATRWLQERTGTATQRWIFVVARK